MVSRIRLLATLVAVLCPFLPRCGAAQEATPSVVTLDGRSGILGAVDARAVSRAEISRADFEDARLVGTPVRAELRSVRPARRSPATWGEWVTEALAPGPPDDGQRFERVFEARLHAPGSPFRSERRRAGDAAGALSSGRGSGLDLPEFLPVRLRADIHRAQARIQALRTLLFGKRGILRLGEDEDSGHSRFRLNLQYDPDPGLRFVLLTR